MGARWVLFNSHLGATMEDKGQVQQAGVIVPRVIIHVWLYIRERHFQVETLASSSEPALYEMTFLFHLVPTTFNAVDGRLVT